MTSLFGGTGVLNANTNGSIVPQHIVATLNQTAFVLTAFTYTPNTNSLSVFINGILQVSGRDFTETSSTSFTLLHNIAVGAYVDCYGVPNVTLNATTAGSVSISSGYSLSNYIADNVINPKVFPFFAKGDGINDDTVAINLALAAAGTLIGSLNPGYGSQVTNAVCLTTGNYLTTGSLLVPEGVQFTATSRSSCRIIANHTGAIIIAGGNNTINTTAYKANIIINNIGMYSLSNANTTIGVQCINTVRQCAIQNNWIYNVATGVDLTNSGSWAMAIRDNLIQNVSVNFIHGQATNTLIIDNNRMETCAGIGVVIDGSTNVNVPPLLIQFTRNSIQGCQTTVVQYIDCQQVFHAHNDQEQNMLGGGAGAEVQVLTGAQNRTCKNFVGFANFFSSGTGASVSHRVFDLRASTNVIVEFNLTSGGTNNFDRGVLLASTVAYARIQNNNWDGCNNPVDYTAGATQMFWYDESGRFLLGDSRAAQNGTIFDVQHSSANQNLVSFCNPSATAGSVCLTLKAGDAAGATFPLTIYDSASALAARVDSSGGLAVRKLMGGNGTAIQTASSLLMGAGVPGAGVGNNSDFYLNFSGTTGSLLYHKVAGAWVASAA